MALSNYPAGVTGTELAIAGPDFEDESHEFCGVCDEEVDGTLWRYAGDEFFECVNGHQTVLSGAPDMDSCYEDDEYDRWVERQLGDL